MTCVNCENFYESIDKHIIMLYYFTNKTDISFSVITVNAQTGNATQEEVDCGRIKTSGGIIGGGGIMGSEDEETLNSLGYVPTVQLNGNSFQGLLD